jgi:hypothetical protein
MSFVLVALLSFAQASAAPQTVPPPPAQPAQTAKAEKSKRMKKVCKTEDADSGTRFARKVCRTIEDTGADSKADGRD